MSQKVKMNEKEKKKKGKLVRKGITVAVVSHSVN